MNDQQFNTHLQNQGIHLNPQQADAVRAVDGATLLLAVPGSGKTTTLIARIGYMILCRGIDPEKILTLTYTNAATRDMQRRFTEVFGQVTAQPVRFQTINSLCNGIINEYVRQTGGNKFDLVTDTGAIVSQLYRKVYQEFASEGEVSEAVKTIAYIKNMRLPDEEIGGLQIADNPAQPLVRAYREHMRRNRLMDFDDQLTISYQILRRYPQLLEQFRARYPYILVDEAQDTSKVQHEIIELLAGPSPNLFMVGDEDQSIYGFRAAYPQALLDFEETYANARVLFLEENYRSTPQIVEAAGKFIAVNRKRKEKHMYTERPAGPQISYIELDSRYGQYFYLAKCLEDIRADAAVLFRNNDSAIPLIYTLRKKGISYKSREIETSFFSHKVLRDVRDFTAFAEDPADAEVFLRIYYKTGLKISREKAMNVVREYDPDIDRGLFHTYLRVYGGKSKGRERIRKVIDEFAALKKDYAWEAIGRIEHQLRRTDTNDHEKFFILRVLAERGENIHAYFDKLDQLKVILGERTEDADAHVTVSTVHSSKGLEYPAVYIIDAVDGVIPSADAEDIEEERRIFYVAMTRAKTRLNILCYGNLKMPFVDLLRGKKSGTGMLGSKKPGGAGSTGRRIDVQENAPAKEFFRRGQRVRHVTKGRGTVIRLEDDKVIVHFDNGREAKILAEYSVKNGLMDVLEKVK